MYDSCATAQDLNDNRVIHDYFLLNHRRSRPCTGGEYGLWNGFGLERSMVDSDSEIRTMQQTHFGERHQTAVRTFHAVPDLSRGRHLPARESQLLQGGQVTTDARNCRSTEDNTVERDFDRFDPCLLVHPVSVSNIVPTWTRGGASSRDISLSQPFQDGMQTIRSRQASLQAPAYSAIEWQTLPAAPAPAQPADDSLPMNPAMQGIVNI